MFEAGREFKGEFFTEELIRVREVEAEVKNEPTDEEEAKASYQKLLERIKEYDEKVELRISDEKVVNFEVMAALTGRLAKDENYNILISRDDRMGKIVIETDKFAFERFMNEDRKEQFLDIIKKADSVWCEPVIKEIGGVDTNMMCLRLMYKLYDEIKK